MPDRRLPHWLGAMLPARTSQDVFYPAVQDATIAHLNRYARTRSPAYRAVLGACFAAQCVKFWIECWGPAVAELLRPGRTPCEEQLAIEAAREHFPMFLNDLRNAFRLLLREPGFTFAALLTLALGVGANVAVFAVVEAVLLRPLPYPQSDQLVMLHHRDQQTGITKKFIAIGDYVDLTQRQSTFESVAGFGNIQATIFGVGDSFRVAALVATPALLPTLDARPSLGRSLEPGDSREGSAPVMMLGYELWQSHFGSDPNIVGRGVKVDQKERQVVGVAPPGFRFPPNAHTDVILPIPMPAQAPTQRKSGWTFAVARLKPNMSLQQATVNLASLSRQLQQEYPASNQGSEYFAMPLRDALVGNTKPALVLVLGAVGVVLLIACANVANLLLARSLKRRREMAIRVALGAGSRRLVAQLLTESLALAVTAGSAGILIAHWGSRALVTLIPRSVDVPGLNDVHLNGGVLAFALGISVVSTLVFGLVSAFTVRSGSAPGELVAPGRLTIGRSARRAASALVVVEVALAIVLLIGGGLILRTFSRLMAVDPGFRTERVMTMTVSFPEERYRDRTARNALYTRLFSELQALPDVDQTGAAVVVPLTGNNWTAPFERPEHPVPAGERPPEVGWQLASGGYFRALQIPLLTGRLFDERDRPDGKRVVIVSAAIERRYFPHESAVGREVKLGEDRFEIVGVVGNIRRAGLRDELRSDMYFPFERNPVNWITLFIHTHSDAARALPRLQSTLRSIEKGVTIIETRTMAEIMQDSVQVTRLAMWLLGAFAATALFLATVGIYGVMSYAVRQRTREIGTRVALGATQRDIVWLILRQGTGIAALGAAIGLLAGLLAARSITSMLFGVSASDPVTLLAATAVLMITVIAGCYLPARRAARVDPIRALTEP